MKKSNFTLIEMLVVIMIFLVLAGLTFGTIKVVYAKADKTRDNHRIQILIQAIETYKKHYGYYPPSVAVLELNKDVDTDGVPDFFQGQSWFFGKNSADGTQRNREIWANIAHGANSSLGIVDSNKSTFFYQCPGSMNKQSYDLWGVGRDEDHGDDDNGEALDNDPSDASTREKNDDVTNWK